MDVALAGKHESEAATAARKLEIAYAVADAMISLVAAREVVRAAQANLERARVFATTVKPLVDQNLRPGAELARADAEVALATTQLVRAEQGVEVRRAQLAEALGVTDHSVEIDAGGLLDPIENVRAPDSSDLSKSPRVVEADAAARRTQEKVRAVRIEYLPRVELVASVWLRGSGYYSNVGIGGGEGLVPDIPNWAAGAVVTWPLFDIPRIRARTSIATAQGNAATSRKNEIVLAVASELRTASAMFDGASRVAKSTPTTLSSARAAETQARARYQAGLTSAVDVADAQRLLAQAELDDMLARLEVRRAALLFARATGDLGSFLSMAKASAQVAQTQFPPPSVSGSR